MEQQGLSLLQNFEKDSLWFHENINKLRKEGFSGKFVAIKDTKPLTSGKDINLLMSDIEKKGVNPSYVFIEFVHPEGFTLIL
jgi:hypothetical protein